MARESDTLRELMSAIKGAQRQKTRAYDTIATVTRIENGVAWCHIPGGIDETPIRMTVNAEKGDTVQVRVSNGRAFLVGNATAPPTDDKKANAAQDTADAASVIAKKARELAELARRKTRENAEIFAQEILAINNTVQNLQDQVDGNVTTWFYAYVPATNNYPASEWIQDGTEAVHLGDLFYDTSTGYAYRWMSDGQEPPVYSWQRITDTDVTKALADAAKAQDTADQKRRVFYVTPPSLPTPPYDAGDLWAQGSDGDIKRCVQGRALGETAQASDWILASKYTDDTYPKKFLTETTDDGIFVHPDGDSTNGVKITDQVEIIRNNVVVATYGITTILGTGDNNIVLDPRASATVAMKIGKALNVDPDGNATLQGVLSTSGGEISLEEIEITPSIHSKRLVFTTSGGVSCKAEDENGDEVLSEIITFGADSYTGHAIVNLGSRNVDLISLYPIVNFYDRINTQDIYVKGHASAIGNTVSGSDTVSLANSTSMIKAGDLITLGAGTWVITVGARFTGNATGTRAVQIYIDGAGDGPGYESGNVAGGGQFSLNCSTVASSTSSMDIDLYARQNSGGALSVTYYWKAVRIA